MRLVVLIMITVHRYLALWVGLVLGHGMIEPTYSQEQASPKEVLEVPFVRNRISVNGILDEWKEYKGIRFAPLGETSSLSSSVWVRAAWNEEKLYLAFRVKDESLFAHETSDAGTPWRDDAIEVYLGVDPTAARTARFSPNEFQFIINLNGAVGSCRGTSSGTRDHSWDADILSGVRWVGSLNDDAGAKDKQYTVEIAIPWQALGVNAKTDLELLVDFAVTDRVQADTAVADLFYYDWAGLEKFGNPASWNRLILRRAPRSGVWNPAEEQDAVIGLWAWLAILLALSILLWWGFRYKTGGALSVVQEEGGQQPESKSKPESLSEIEKGEGREPDGQVSEGLLILARRVKQILMEEYAGDLSAASVAERLRVSERHMRRALKAAEGQNFSKMLQEIRLQKACELLKKNELSIAEVALGAGFGEQSYFSKLFKASYGRSPSEYRARVGGK